MAVLVAFLAGAIAVHLYYAMKPAAFDEPADVFAGGVRIQKVAGARQRAGIFLLLEIGALIACLVFLAGSLSTLP